MRIGIDARLWNETGVGRYIRNLVWELEKIDKKNHYTLFVTPESFDSKAFDFAQSKKEQWSLVSTDIKWHTVDEQLLFHKVLGNESLDLMHFPYFSIPILYNKPFVMTVHDLIIHHFPTGKASTLPLPVYYAKRWGYQHILKQAARKSQHIITVSKETKREIVKHLKVSEKKVSVTYEGVDKLISGIENREWGIGIDGKYFLYVGNAYPHKNIESLVEAFALVIKEFPEVKLVLVGKKNYFYDRLEEKVKHLDLEKTVIFAGGVSDEELAALYKNAEAFVFPSLMEGFGLPGLEAMQNNCLVLASDIPVFKEIYKDAAIYFNPREIASIHATIRQVLTEKKKFSTYLKKGEERVKTFSWEKMAKETLDIYENSFSLRQN